jgi:hypothetical protein
MLGTAGIGKLLMSKGGSGGGGLVPYSGGGGGLVPYSGGGGGPTPPSGGGGIPKATGLLFILAGIAAIAGGIVLIDKAWRKAETAAKEAEQQAE